MHGLLRLVSRRLQVMADSTSPDLPLPATSSPPSICASTILDVGRLPNLLRIRRAWAGELSASILARQGGSFDMQLQELRTSLRARRRLQAFLVENVGYDCPIRFPYNLLRNVAIGGCINSTAAEFLLYLDVDLVPAPAGAEAYAGLCRFLANARLARQTAWVLPAFELSAAGEREYGPHYRYFINGAVPRHQLRELIAARRVAPFYSGVRLPPNSSTPTSAAIELELEPTDEGFSNAYRCTQHARWLRGAPHGYAIRHCSGHYEPYVVVHRAVGQRFDESFARGFDKVSYVYELFARNLSFQPAPEHYLLHLPHSSAPPPAFAGTATPPPRRCDREPVRDAIQPWAGMPSHTCVDRFLTRVKRAHGYAPVTGDHKSLRRWAVQWRGKCHTDEAAMARKHLVGLGMPTRAPRIGRIIGSNLR